ncbi:MAG: type II secretion system protein [Armatimonadetes bacterium]|nr:type II secretion system protein [Armatimonadota bacterium]
MKRERFTGFTLIELLVVIAIIVILAGILFPVFARAKTAAKKTADLANIKQISVSLNLYTTDFDEYFLVFPYADTWSTPAFSARQKGPYWSDRLMPYMKNQEVFQTPANTDRVFYPRGYWVPGAKSASETQPSYRVTYALNHLLTRAEKNPNIPGASSMQAIEDVSSTAMVGPGQQPWGFSACYEEPAGSGITHYVWMFSDSDAGFGYELFGGRNQHGGFDGGVNFAFADTHAKFDRASDIGTAPGDAYPIHSRLFFRGLFPHTKTRPNVATDGTCPADRGNMVF